MEKKPLLPLHLTFVSSVPLMHCVSRLTCSDAGWFWSGPTPLRPWRIFSEKLHRNFMMVSIVSSVSPIGSGTSHATTAPLKPSFRAPWRVGDKCGRQRKCWMDNIKEWTFLLIPELLTMASCRKEKKIISAESSLMSP